jgi:hypothetical protein
MGLKKIERTSQQAIISDNNFVELGAKERVLLANLALKFFHNSLKTNVSWRNPLK